MECTFKTFKKKYRCKSKDHALQIVAELFESIADFPYWIEKIEIIQRQVFNPLPDLDLLFPDTIMYQGNLILKFIYAGKHLQNHKLDSEWIFNLEKHIQKMIPATKYQQYPEFIRLLYYSPKQLNSNEILNPSAYLQKFYSQRKVLQWVKRWNRFREYAIFPFSVCEGDEGEFLEDFHSFPKLIEAIYLVYISHKFKSESSDLSQDLP